MKTTVEVKDGKTTITTGDMRSVFAGECEPAADVIELLQTALWEQARIIDKLPKCWRPGDGVPVKDRPLYPGKRVTLTADAKVTAGRLFNQKPDDQVFVVAAISGDLITLHHERHETFGTVHPAYCVSHEPEAAKALAQRSDDDEG